MESITSALSASRLIIFILNNESLSSARKMVENFFHQTRILDAAQIWHTDALDNTKTSKRQNEGQSEPELKIPKITWDDVGGLNDAKR